MLRPPLDLAAWSSRINGRPLYLWGAGQSGMGLLQALRRNGIEPDGFIDKRVALHGRAVEGLMVHSPESVLRRAHLATRPFIVNCTFQYEDEIFRRCAGSGLRHDLDYVSLSDLQPLHYQISVAGICNLHCISCPLGNIEKYAAGYMSAATYQKVLDKVLRDSPMVGLVQLYNWGEPMLNRELPEIIRTTNAHDVMCAISSNLNIKRDFRDVVAAKPGSFRVSVSGDRKTYANTHTGGNWDRLITNMYTLAEHRSTYHPDMQVEVTYHLYQDTTEAGYRYMEDLCGQLGYVFRSHMAALLPLENVEAYRDRRGLSPAARATTENLMLSMEDALAIAQSQSDTACTVENTVMIDADLRVKHCGLYYQLEDNVVADNFLELPMSELVRRRNDSALCARCKSGGLHRYCRVYTDEKIPPFAAPPQAQRPPRHLHILADGGLDA